MTRRLLYLLPILAGALVLAAVALSLTQTQAEAQCGSQASSCKNCHEAQNQLPVNHDGTGWHESHAFGDFCANCHGGNVQSIDAAAAHTSMVAPLSDLPANCAACHPNDTEELATVYAAVLGVELGGGDSTTGAGAGVSTTPTTPAPAPTTAVVAGSSEGVPDLIDYNQQYADTVEGRPLNWGNVLLGLLIVALAGGGGAFAYVNERKLRRPATATATATAVPPAGQPAAPSVAPLAAGRTDLSELLPQLEQLDPRSLRALQQILREPEVANGLLLTLSRLDPRLIEEVRRLDRREMSLLVALAEEQ